MNRVSARDNFDRWALFLLGVGAYPTIKVVGYISLSELALFALVPYLVVTRIGAISGSHIRTFLALLLVWLASAVFSDLYRGTAFDQYSRGWARVCMLGFSLFTFYVLLKGRPRLYLYFLAGLTISSIIVLKYGRVGLADYEASTGDLWVNTWETAYVYVALAATMLWVGIRWHNHPIQTALVMVVMGAANFFLGARAFGAILLMSAATALFFRYSHFARQFASGRLNWGRLLRLTLFASLIGYGVFEGYVTLAANGDLGAESRAKYMMQAHGRYGVILTGRSNVVGAAMALWDSPLIGYGSWAQDRNGYFYRAILFVGYDPREMVSDEDLLSGRIPTHSYLLEAWVEHGFLAALFWIYTLYFLLQFIRRLPFSDDALVALMWIQFWLFCWNIFFSPTGSRIVIGAALASMIVVHELAKHRRRTVPLDQYPAIETSAAAWR